MLNKLKLLTSAFAVLMCSTAIMAQDVFDTDQDGFDDNNDNCTLTFNPDQRDTDGDSFGNRCDADFDGNQAINFLDFTYIQQNFLTNDEDADLNGDGSVNFLDIAVFSELFLAVPGPTGTDPEQPPCTCYFSSDCPSGTFCDYGPGNFATEDICVWRDIKPNGVVDAGCSIESDLTTGAWIPDICDGVCASFTNGSIFGLEDTKQVAKAMLLWGDAMLYPSEAGGGPVDEAIATEVRALEFKTPDTPIMLGRYAADALAMSAGEAFNDYFCHYEGHPEDENQPTVDLSAEPCRVLSGHVTMRALASELLEPGTAGEIMQEIASSCDNWQELFVAECEAGPGALNCAIKYIESQAFFLRTPPKPTETDNVMEMLGVTASR